MAKTYGADRKWTTGRSRVVRPADTTKAKNNLLNSIKILLKKRPWDK